MRKQKDSTHAKREAFMSFLEAPTTVQQDTRKNNSDHEEVYQEELTQKSNCCNVCGMEVAENMKNKQCCAFCDLVACKNHLRKRRRKKNKWQKICDCCEDKFIYDSYMRLQKKKQQSLMVEQEIVTMKHDNLSEVFGNKKSRRDQLLEKQQEINRKFNEELEKLMEEENSMEKQKSLIDHEMESCEQLREQIERINNKIKENYVEDYLIMEKENEKLIKELSIVEKKCLEIRTAFKKRQKQIEMAYEEWEQKEQKKNELKKKQEREKGQDCTIF